MAKQITQTCTCGNARCQAGLQRGLPPVCRTPLPAVVPELGIEAESFEADESDREPDEDIDDGPAYIHDIHGRDAQRADEVDAEWARS